MTDLIGIPTSLTVRISRRLTDGNYGSFEVSAELTSSLPPEVNLDEAFDSHDAWLTAVVAKSVSEKQVDIVAQAPSVAQHAQQPQEVERVPVVGDAEVATFEVSSYVIEYSPTGQKSLKVKEAKGGKYSVYGVKVWPEIAEKNAQLSAWESKDAGEYAIAGKLVAVVMLEGGKAKKVIGWK
jgi:hypothetical protein